MAEAFHEVDAQVRAARFQFLLRRSWPYALGIAAVAAVVAMAAWLLNQHEHAQASTASERYSYATQAIQRGDIKGAAAGFADLGKGGPRGYRALALMQQAGVALNTDKGSVATPLLDQAGQLAPNAVLGDAARLEAAYTALDAGRYADARARLLPLTSTGRPYRLLAMEALGLEELASGRMDQARGDLRVVALSSDSSDAQRSRANAALALISSGSWSSLKPLAQAAASLKAEQPPQAPAGLSGVPGAAPGGATPGGSSATPSQ